MGPRRAPAISANPPRTSDSAPEGLKATRLAGGLPGRRASPSWTRSHLHRGQFVDVDEKSAGAPARKGWPSHMALAASRSSASTML